MTAAGVAERTYDVFSSKRPVRKFGSEKLGRNSAPKPGLGVRVRLALLELSVRLVKPENVHTIRD